MGVPAEVRDAYIAVEPTLRALQEYLRAALRPWCDRRGFAFLDRIKTVESLAEKLESGRYARWSDLDDLYAATIVVPTAKREEDVLAFLTVLAVEDELRRRNSTRKPPDVFRFDTTRFIGRLNPPEELGLPANINRIKFEVQIPTVFEHAWAVATHDLVYKGDAVTWNNLRLAAQLKAAVEQIDLLIATFEMTAEAIGPSEHGETDAKARAVSVLKGLVESGGLPIELAPASWRRLADNVFALARSANRGDPVAKMNEIVDAVADEAKNGTLAPGISGSLFQYILGVMNQRLEGPETHRRFTVVPSQELNGLYQVRELPRQFDFD